jgi:hypothetical protein
MLVDIDLAYFRVAERFPSEVTVTLRENFFGDCEPTRDRLRPVQQRDAPTAGNEEVPCDA